MGTATYRQIGGPDGYLAHLTPFDGNSMRGVNAGEWSSYWNGRLNTEERDLFVDQMTAGNIKYVVVSYNTPIAWVFNDGSVHRVAQKFSVTTSKQQGKLAWLGTAIPGSVAQIEHDAMLARWEAERQQRLANDALTYA